MEIGRCKPRDREKDGAGALRRFRLFGGRKEKFQWGLAAEAAAESIAVSAAAEEKKDDPQTTVIAASAAKAVAASAAAEEQKDDPQAAIVAEAASAFSTISSYA